MGTRTPDDADDADDVGASSRVGGGSGDLAGVVRRTRPK